MWLDVHTWRVDECWVSPTKKGRKQKKLQYTAIELRQKATKTQIRNKLEISHESAKWLRSLLGLVMCTFMDWVAVPRFVHGEAAETPIPMDIIIFPIKNGHLGGAAHSQTHPIEYKLSITSMIYYHIVSHLIGNGSCRISPSEKAISGWITDTLNHRPTRFILLGNFMQLYILSIPIFFSILIPYSHS
jgi:hypothetical protein